MVNLNLIAKTSKQKIILKHLTPLISNAVAEKINNGVTVEKDGKQLISRKDLDTLMEYLYEQAKSQIPTNEQRGHQCVCMEGDEIMNIVVHYFEEDSIHGKLFNLDGTEYEPPKPTTKAVKPTTPYTPPAPKPKPQLNIFDMLSDGAESAKTETPQTAVAAEPKKQEISPMYQHYLSVKEKYKNCIVFYRLGDFYEMFNGDAITAADVLNLTLTGRDFGLAERVPMVDVPFHAVDAYIEKLVKNGYKVVVVERLDGNTEKTVERVIAPKPTEAEQPAALNVDEDTGEILSDDEELSVEEMQKFDGDIDEADEIPTVSKLLDGVDIPDDSEAPDDDFDIEQEREKLKAFETNAVIILADIFGKIFTLE